MWNYGTRYSFPTTKNAWSHYVHPSKYHSATAICGSNSVRSTPTLAPGGRRHEVQREPEHRDVLADILTWIQLACFRMCSA